MYDGECVRYQRDEIFEMYPLSKLKSKSAPQGEQKPVPCNTAFIMRIKSENTKF